MRAVNHALTGSLIGLVINNPIALPLAVISHFVLDAIPHYGNDDNENIKSNQFAVELLLDAILCGLLVLLLVINNPSNWFLAALCAFLAASPDFMWLSRFIRARKDKKETKSNNPVVRFHSWIQWFQKPIGLVVEAAWFICSVFLLAKII